MACFRHGENHHKAKITLETVRAIRASKEKLTVLAARFNISYSQVGKIRRGDSWQKDR